MNPVFAEYGLKDLLPLKLDIPDEGCTRPNKSMFCFEAGKYARCNIIIYKFYIFKIIIVDLFYLFIAIRWNQGERTTGTHLHAHFDGTRAQQTC